MTFVDKQIIPPEWFQDLTGQGVFITDNDLIIRSWSRWLESHSGLLADAVIGRGLLAVFPELVTRHLERYYELAHSGQTTVLAQRLHRYLLPLPSPDPAFEHMQQRARIGPLIENGRVTGTVTVIEDVTERVAVEQELVRLLAQEQAARAAAEAHQRRLALLADVSALLAASFDDTTALPQVARVLLPLLGEYCIIDLIAEGAQVRRVALVHIDPADEALLWTLEQQYVATHPARHPGVIALRTGSAEMIADLTEAIAAQRVHDDGQRLLLQTLATRSLLAVPLLARGQTFGALTLCSTQPDRYRAEDRELVEDLARRIALAIDNTRLYRAMQEALTARDRALAVVESERAKLHRLFTQAPAAICMLQGPQHIYTFANLLYRQAVGDRELIGKPVREALPELADQGIFELLDGVYITGEPVIGNEVPMEFVQRDQTLGIFFFNFVYQPTRDADKHIDGILVHAVNVTDQVRARQTREALEAAVRAQREHLRVTLSSIGDAVIVTDTQGHITFINRVAEALTGWPQTEAFDQPITRVFALDQADRSTLVARNGTIMPIESSAAPIRDDTNQTIGTVLVFRDISERRRVEQERLELLARTDAARAEAEAAVRMRDLFFSVAAHELKTPLTSLLGTIQLIQRRIARDDLLPEREQRSFTVVVSQAQRLQQMIEALLDITRLESGQLSLNPMPVALDELVQRVVQEVQPTLVNHEISYEPLEQMLVVNGDALRLEQVFQNLIQNAVKYSPAGGTVTVTVVQEGANACVAVSDQGIGIPAESLPLLFQRFYRATNVSSAQHVSGMGIGLFVVKEIITLHGGSVTVASSEGVGSTFTVCLPLLDQTGDGRREMDL